MASLQALRSHIFGTITFVIEVLLCPFKSSGLFFAITYHIILKWGLFFRFFFGFFFFKKDREIGVKQLSSSRSHAAKCPLPLALGVSQHGTALDLQREEKWQMRLSGLPPCWKIVVNLNGLYPSDIIWWTNQSSSEILLLLPGRTQKWLSDNRGTIPPHVCRAAATMAFSTKAACGHAALNILKEKRREVGNNILPPQPCPPCRHIFWPRKKLVIPKLGCPLMGRSIGQGSGGICDSAPCQAVFSHESLKKHHSPVSYNLRSWLLPTG